MTPPGGMASSNVARSSSVTVTSREPKIAVEMVERSRADDRRGYARLLRTPRHRQLTGSCSLSDSARSARASL